VIRHDKQLIPIEVKWTDSPTAADTKHLTVFLQEYPQTSHAYVVCRTPKRLKLADKIVAINWRDIAEIL